MKAIEAIKKRLIHHNTVGIKQSDPIEIRQANAGLSRIPLSEYLHYVEFEDGLMINLVGEDLYVGFGFHIASYSMINDQAAIQLEVLFKSLPTDAVAQCIEFATDNVKPRVDLWEAWQNKYCDDPMISKMTGYRAKMLRDSAHKTLHETSKLKLRNMVRHIFVTVPFKGNLGVKTEVDSFFNEIRSHEKRLKGSLSKANLNPHPMNRDHVLSLLRKLANPHKSYQELEESNPIHSDTKLKPGEYLKDHIAMRNTSLEVLPGGGLRFSSGTGDDVVAQHITVDRYPDSTHLHEFGRLTGDLYNRDERINQPYFLYTIVHKCNKDEAKELVEANMAWLGKQAKEGSDWLKNSMPHLYERVGACKEFISDTRESDPVRMFTGIIVYCDPRTVETDVEELRSFWNDRGYRATEERHISFPMWTSTLPWQYIPDWDKPRTGLARAQMAKSINAASCLPIVGDWTGLVPMVKKDFDGNPYHYCNGVPLVTGRGEIGFLDLFASETNYNFTCLATSGAGKSFFCNDLVRDIRARGGLAFVFDMGRSYKDACELQGGSNLDFEVAKPISINHFWGIETSEEFMSMKDLLVESVVTIAFPSSRPDNKQMQSLKRGIFEAWLIFGSELGLKEMYSYFTGQVELQVEVSARDLDELNKVDTEVVGSINEEIIEEQKIDYKRTLAHIGGLMYEYSVGKDRIWFNGKPDIDLNNPFTILELNDLENSPELKSIVFTTIIMLVTRRIYSYDRQVPKLLLIDEAWNLLSDDRAGPFIEKAFRTIRKFFGAAGIISQSCKDVDISEASKAAWSNSAWRIFLMQKSDSVAHAKKEEMFGSSTEAVCEVMEGLRRVDNYSEVLVTYDNMFYPYRFFVDPFSAFCYSSKATDKAYVEKLMEQKKISKEEAIQMAAGM